MGGRAQEPVYVSKPQGKNIWQEYRVFCDRIELDSKLRAR
jgi:hypothetical protein